LTAQHYFSHLMAAMQHACLMLCVSSLSDFFSACLNIMLSKFMLITLMMSYKMAE